MRVGCYQFAPEPGAVAANLARIRRMLAGVQADLLVLPELCLSGYLFPSREALRRCAEPVPDGPCLRALAATCAERSLNLVLGIAELAGDRLFNTAVLITGGGTIHRYRKAHLFMDEKDLFDPGDTPFPVFTLGPVRIGLLVCFDHFYPEAARALALRGAQIVCHPANLVLEHAQTTTRSRAIENRLFWLMANRTGVEADARRSLAFTGASQIVAPDGRVLVKAGPDAEELIVVEIDPTQALDKHVTPRNDLLADRRTDLYSA
ncbi:MAG: nitrilase-related carbon-nitrogen hydrolase [candidate division WOR-3 bacterium]